MHTKRVLLSLVVTTFISILLAGSFAEGAEVESLAERLGYSRSDKLLIVHADDVGIAHSVNVATFEALATGQVSSASVMVPCPWLQEVADFAKIHPEADLGLHLTLTSEWHPFRWGPVASKKDVPSLVSSLGYFYTIREALAHLSPQEVEIELKAQIQLARAMGIEPTHLDSHQLLLFFRPQLFETYLKVGRDTGLPILLAKGVFSWIEQRMGEATPDYESYLKPGDIVIDDVLSITPEEAANGWPAFYEDALANLKPGVSQLIVHVGLDNEELRGIAGDVPFGSSWRQKELEYLTGTQFGDLLKKHDIKLITWREIANLKEQR